MSVTLNELQRFTEFARQKLNNGGADSLAALVSQWEQSRREYREAVADIQQGQADYAAGKGKPVAEAFADIRAKLGIES